VSSFRKDEDDILDPKKQLAQLVAPVWGDYSVGALDLTAGPQLSYTMNLEDYRAMPADWS
jgi:hypothetical protein